MEISPKSAHQKAREVLNEDLFWNPLQESAQGEYIFQKMMKNFDEKQQWKS